MRAAGVRLQGTGLPADRFATVRRACRRSYLSAQGEGPERNPTFEGNASMRIRTLIAAALMTLVVSATAPAAMAGQRRQMIRTINNARALGHLRGLHFSSRLSRGAAAWARYLMRRQVLAHAGGQQGEVIEWHTGGQPMIRRTVVEWLHSAGHRRVML